MKSSEMSEGRNASKKVGNHCSKYLQVVSFSAVVESLKIIVSMRNSRLQHDLF